MKSPIVTLALLATLTLAACTSPAPAPAPDVPAASEAETQSGVSLGDCIAEYIGVGSVVPTMMVAKA